MINLKTNEEIKIMIEGGKKLKKVVDLLIKQIKPGIKTKEIDKIAEKLIINEKGEPSFKKVKDYYWTTCLPVNEQAVHTPPNDRVLKDGDLLTVDIGMYYKGFHTDYATSFIVGEKKDEKIEKFLEAGKKALEKAISKAKINHRLGDISETIEKEIKSYGYFVLKELTGHGIGKKLHEDPYVFQFLNKKKEKTMVLKEGLVLAIEVIYAFSTEEIAYEKNNNWSILSKDRSLTACFEKTIAITEKKTLVLT